MLTHTLRIWPVLLACRPCLPLIQNKSSVPPCNQSFWATLIEAIRGSEADYTQIRLRRAVFLLAGPMILELVMESTFAVVDIYFVGKLGSSAVATVGITETFMFLLYSVAMGLATAVIAIVARHIGQHH